MTWPEAIVRIVAVLSIVGLSALILVGWYKIIMK